MKKHVLRPLWAAIGLVLLILIARPFLVPDDFGVHGKSFTYGYYRLSNVQEWKDFPVKYQGRDYCAGCHADHVAQNSASSHQSIQCENCHGAAAGHPGEIAKLTVDKSRELCLRCHADLGYPNSSRASLPSIDGERHKRNRECSKCHNPHNPAEDT